MINKIKSQPMIINMLIHEKRRRNGNRKKDKNRNKYC